MKTQLIFSTFFVLAFSVLVCAQDAIHVQKLGTGEPLLLLPGFANSSEVWKETIEHLDAAHEIHLVDYAGFNGTTPVEMPWLPQVNSALVDYIKTENLTNLTIIGHSLGGTLATYLASELQDHIKEIIVVDALPHTAKLMFPNQTEIKYDNPFSNSQLTMEDAAFKTMILQQVKMMSYAENKHSQIADWITNTDRKTYVYGYIDYLNFNATPYLENIQCPVSIFAATSYGEDQSRQTYTDQYKSLKTYDLKMAPISAHYIMFDQPDWFYENLKLALND